MKALSIADYDSVTFGYHASDSVTFGHLFRLLFNTPLDYINHLIDKTFGGHQEYTIATSYLAPARGTKQMNCLEPNSSFAFFPEVVTVNVITCFDIGIKFFPCRIIKVLGTGRYR